MNKHIRSYMQYGNTNGTKPHALISFSKATDTEFPDHEIFYTDFSASGTRKLHYIQGGDGLAAIYVQNNGSDTMYYAFSDFQGNLVALTTTANAGKVVERYAYDPWGNRRNPADWSLSDTRTTFLIHRGYTLHEHLDDFGLINMSGRVYDPRMGTFLSPDPYIQAPGNWLNYNRYTYCLNNPLLYTDPSGEWFLGYAIVFAVNYLAKSATSGDWGWNSVGSAAIATAGYGFSNLGDLSFLEGIGNFFNYTVGSATVQVATSFMPSVNMPISDKFSLSASMGIGLGSNGLVGGLNVSGTYHDGDDAYTLGLGYNTNSISIGGGYGNKDWGISYYATRYGNAIEPDGQPNPQTVAGLSFWSGKFSARIENDFLALNGDRWRSNAVELGFFGGKAVVGTTLYNNYMKDGDEINYDDGYEHRDLLGRRYDKWENGQTYSSPFYVGVRSGNNIARIGYSHRIFQHAFQNWFTHEAGFGRLRLFGHANYFMGYDDFQSGYYNYSGYYNPYSLWGR